MTTHAMTTHSFSFFPGRRPVAIIAVLGLIIVLFPQAHTEALMTAQSAKIVGWDSVAEDEFGAAVGLSGSVAVVGAPGDNDVGANSGSVYVFERNRKGANIWGDTRKLVANDATAGATFGAAVAISGDTVVVGAPLSAKAGAEAGAAYVFVRSQTDAESWNQVASLRVENIAIGGRLGSTVAISGDTVVVGAPLAGGGEVYIFERNRGGADAWGQVALLRARGIDRFGSALAISGDTIAVGAPLANDGVVYVFERNQGGPDRWGVVATVRAAAGKEGDRFGNAVGLDKDILVVGAPESDAIASAAGAAYVFYRNQGGADRWGQVAVLAIGTLGADDKLGSAVSVSGDVAIVGARLDDTFGVNAGATYIFERNQGGADRWGAVAKFSGDDTRSGDRFGEALVLQGNTLLVGVRADSDVGVNSGAAYAFLRSGNAWIQRAKLTADDAASNDSFGQAVAISGATVAIGAYQDDDRGGDSGSVYVLRRNLRGVDRWGLEAKVIAGDGASGDQFGQVVALDGDTLVVGAAFADVAGADAGSAYVFNRNRGGADNWGLVAKLIAGDASAGDFFGSSVAVSGDTVLVGAFADDDVGSASGSAYIFERNRGGADNWGQVAKLTAADAEATDQFGFSVALSGDTAVVGAQFESSAGNYGGAAYVFERNQGGADAWGQTAKLGANDGRANDQFGFAVAMAEETILVGAPGKDDVGANTGAAYIFVPNRGSAIPWIQAAKLSHADADMGDRFGESVAISGETALVGAGRNSDAAEETGSAYVFSRNQGGTDNWGQLIKLIAADIAGGDQFGVSVAIDGNFAIIGSPFEDGAASATGAGYIFQLQF